MADRKDIIVNDKNYYIADPHKSAVAMKDSLPDKIWNNYLKISTVRCPYDMMISQYFWRHTNHKGRVGNFNIFILRDWEHVKNYKMLCIGCRSAIDFIIRYENIHEDIRELERRLEIHEGGILEHLAPSKNLWVKML